MEEKARPAGVERPAPMKADCGCLFFSCTKQLGKAQVGTGVSAFLFDTWELRGILSQDHFPTFRPYPDPQRCSPSFQRPALADSDCREKGLFFLEFLFWKLTPSTSLKRINNQ